jgi:Ca2+/Na+ antiporter
MDLFLEIIKFIIYSGLIVIISKYILVKTLRNLAESLKLKSKTVGNIAGYATSVPELLTIGISSFNGLIGTSIYNVISSNIINLIQYIFAIILNKNQKILKNRALKIDIILVVITIIIPILIIIFKINIDANIVPAFVILYFLFVLLNNHTHNIYLKNQNNDEIELNIISEEKPIFKTVKYIIYLLITGILLFFIGDRLGNTLENLCNIFNISQTIIGILLGFITSIPELITFFESQKHHKKRNNNVSGVVEATNNLLTSNILNLFIIQSIGILIYTFI